MVKRKAPPVHNKPLIQSRLSINFQRSVRYGLGVLTCIVALGGPVCGADAVANRIQHENRQSGATDWQLTRVRVDASGYRSPWIEAEGDQEIILPVLGVEILLHRLKLGTTYSAANLKMQYNDPAHGVRVVQAIYVDKESKDVAWLIPRVDPTLERYTYEMTLFSDSGTDVTMRNLQGEGSTLLLPPPAV